MDTYGNLKINGLSSPKLVAGATYWATVSGEAEKVENLAGNATMAKKLWTFSVNSPPAITGLAPAPGATVADRTPTIAATVKDAQSVLAKTNATLTVDGGIV